MPSLSGYRLIHIDWYKHILQKNLRTSGVGVTMAPSSSKNTMNATSRQELVITISDSLFSWAFKFLPLLSSIWKRLFYAFKVSKEHTWYRTSTCKHALKVNEDRRCLLVNSAGALHTGKTRKTGVVSHIVTKPNFQDSKKPTFLTAKCPTEWISEQFKY